MDLHLQLTTTYRPLQRKDLRSSRTSSVWLGSVIPWDRTPVTKDQRSQRSQPVTKDQRSQSKTRYPATHHQTTSQKPKKPVEERYPATHHQTNQSTKVHNKPNKHQEFHIHQQVKQDNPPHKSNTSTRSSTTVNQQTPFNHK